MNHGSKIRALALCLLLVACVKKNEKSDDVETTETQPITTTGTFIVNFNNSRARCGFKEKAKTKFDVLCQAVGIDAKGNETLPASLEEGLTLTWQQPKQIVNGEPIAFEGANCRATGQDLAFLCDVTLADLSPTRLRFDLKVTDKKAAREKVESDDVLFPYSVQSFGRLLSAPLAFRPPGVAGGTGARAPERAVISKKTAEVPVGFQNPPLDVSNFSVAYPDSVCVQGARIFFSTANYIYVYDGKELSLYAGTGRRVTGSELSHRLRLYLGPHLYLACRPDALFVSDRDFGRVLRLTDSEPVEVIVSGSDFQTPSGLAVDGPKSLVVVAGERLRRLTQTDGKWRTTFVGDPAFGPISPRGVAIGVKGEVYASHQETRIISTISRTANGSEITTPLPRPTDHWSGNRLPASMTSTGAHVPIGMAVDNNGNLLVAVSDPDTLQKYSKQSDGTWDLSLVSGGGTLLGDNVPAREAKLLEPNGVAVTEVGDIVIADSKNHRLRRVFPSTDGVSVIKTILGNGLPSAPAPEGMDAVDTPIHLVEGIAIAANGTIYYSEPKLNRIRAIERTPDGKRVVRTIAGVGTQLPLSGPSDLAFGPGDTLHILDGGARVLKLVTGPSGAGALESIAGGSASQNLGDGGPALQASLKEASSIAFDSQGNLYIADSGHYVVRRVDGGTKIITTIAGKPNVTGFSGDGGPALDATFTVPIGLALTPNGSIAVSEAAGNRIRQLYPGPSGGYFIRSIAGNSSPGDALDGVIAAGETMNFPWRLASDSEGRIYVSETGRNKLRVLDPTAQSGQYRISTLVGASPPIDCGRVSSGEATAGQIADRLKASVRTICQGQVRAVTVRNTCGQPKGVITIAYSQWLDPGVTDFVGNIVEAVRACTP